ncbi:protein FAM53A [Rhinatrema bivittatum]|uniref:protein FAM53A n=1 Tax=Rhinatrema bivittatum TaxID=194408 RepID=UPI00112D55DE|nr:protein FAM53A [Rhinatrema bivittatum]XP_029448501.1 protein FAM53A [Rhinatrema bivittatum]XP_029448503.1 protein FAM53A [Rhinatrema bivittatum]XP_029448507.1 protein FAM53A [Rhinatrema bivittatum]XP_029448509.1 protein FAM53A [Rhinatrema bivittatum]XP_029448511.1 protein FAM53A [Rhinatrema bivittatum]XP_029448518.1 protein FAM53A [Rhinatrema bivittatum]
MLVSVSSRKGTTTMVTLITEKLENQRLDDLMCKTYNINLHSSEKLNKSGSLFPYEINEDSPWKDINRSCPIRAQANKNSAFTFPACLFSASSASLQWQKESPSTSMVSGWISELNFENPGQPLAPPTKRHCRSLSEPDELARCRSPWKPGSSKVWTPVSKRRCNSGGSATLQRCNSHGSATLQRSTSISLPQSMLSLNNNIFTIASLNTSPVPRPSSASSGFVDSSEGSTNSSINWNCSGPCDFNPRRRLSLSQEHITEAGNLLPSANSTPTSTPELSRRQGLLRCRSQPCVLNERKSRLKRRREEDVRWNRPSLDFLKMTRTLKNSKSLCSLDYEDVDDPHMKTIVSSPCDSNDLMNITPGSSPMKEQLDEVRHHGPCQAERSARDYKQASVVSESDEDTSDSESTEEGIFPLDCGDLDLEQIENN